MDDISLFRLHGCAAQPPPPPCLPRSLPPSPLLLSACGGQPCVTRRLLGHDMALPSHQIWHQLAQPCKRLCPGERTSASLPTNNILFKMILQSTYIVRKFSTGDNFPSRTSRTSTAPFPAFPPSLCRDHIPADTDPSQGVASQDSTAHDEG